MTHTYPSSFPDKSIWTAAKQIETTLVSQMLKSAGLHEFSESFSGGIGEEQFTSLLVEAHSSIIVENGGFGLSEAIYQHLLLQA
ncbi:rod-binding protein [Pelagovum pacificum]|uniref:Flagellar protein FlgJ N-terminal domain-containing protein n=1 Tax=Pelagovum pacificum TaxID=2588711 RepID=A0A5C5GI09_9RHOB|nr:rod-binding protein [Pelagovum pacificum]QQA42991.1 rod-binding protein [Pelagovum pacificum]TNY33864.1 hypothetical protein FHY64_11550 [Pelagovum pacificum]